MPGDSTNMLRDRTSFILFSFIISLLCFQLIPLSYSMTRSEALHSAVDLVNELEARPGCRPSRVHVCQESILPYFGDGCIICSCSAGSCVGTWVVRDLCFGEDHSYPFPFVGSGRDSDEDGIDNCFDYCPNDPNDGPDCKHPLDPEKTEDQYLGSDEDPKFPQCPQKNLKADPINIYNGNHFEQQVDLSFNSPFQGGFAFKRYYNSLSMEQGALGYKWRHNFSVKMNDRFSNTVEVTEIIGPTGKSRYYEDFDRNGIYKGAYLADGTIYGKPGNQNMLWKREDGTSYEFENKNGFLVAITDPNGNVQRLSYDSRSRLASVTDEASGSRLTFHYNGYSNRIDHITGPITPAVPDGVWARYTYEAGKLTKVEYADDGNGSGASGVEYLYEDPANPGKITAKKDLNGTVLSTWKFDAQGRAVENTNNQGTGGRINYDNPNAVEFTDAYGMTSIEHIEMIAGQKKVTKTTHPNGCSSCSDGIFKTAYDETIGLPVRREYVNGRIDLYQDYDDNNNPRTIITAWSSEDEKTVLKNYHPVLSTPLTITEKSLLADELNPDRQKQTVFDYDNPDDPGDTDTPNENPTALVHREIEAGYTLDESHNVVSYEYITQYTYNGKGQVLSVDGPLPGDQDRVEYGYDPATGDLVTITSPLVGTTAFVYDAAGNPIEMTDINQIAHVFTYDGRNRLLSATIDGKTASQTYTAAGLIQSITDRSSRTLARTYNAQGLLDRITAPGNEYLFFGYDANHNLIESSAYSALGELTRYLGYDFGNPAANPDLSPGQPWKTLVRNPENTADLETVYQYRHGNLSQAVDPEGGQTDYLYDTLDRVIQTTQKINGTQDAVTTYGYDIHDNLVSVTDASMNQTRYEYDDNNRLIRQISPDTGTTRFVHDISGNRITQTRQDGTAVVYTYDALGRFTRIETADPLETVVYGYDEHPNGKGRLTSITDSSGTYQYTYDTLGRMIREDKTLFNTAYSTQYAYDDAGNLTGVNYPSGRTITYHRGLSGRVSRVESVSGGQNQTLADTIVHEPFGPIRSFTFANGEQVQTVSDLNYRPKTRSGGTVMDMTLTRDNAGNVKQITDNLEALDQSFIYNHKYELTTATGSYGTIGFTYDPVGNRTRVSDPAVHTYTYLPGTNKVNDIAGPAPVIYGYDPNGNIVTKGTVSYEYTSHNRLKTVKDNGTLLAGYQYNSRGQRTGKTVNTLTTVYHYDISGRLIAESAPDGTMTREYVYLENQPLALIDPTGLEAFYFYHNDHLNTPKTLTDISGQIVWQAGHDPFGRADITTHTIENNLRFPGQYYDAETGLHYNYHRYYDPDTGRYLTPDPIGLEGGINLFAYANQNPINYIDPYGQLAITVPTIIVGGIITIITGYTTGQILKDIYENSRSDPWDDPWDENDREIQREDEYQNYKNRCGQSPPGGLSACDKLRWQLQQAKDCRDLRQSWDDNWYPGRHEQAINDWNNRVNRLQRRISQECCGK